MRQNNEKFDTLEKLKSKLALRETYYGRVLTLKEYQKEEIEIAQLRSQINTIQKAKGDV